MVHNVEARFDLRLEIVKHVAQLLLLFDAHLLSKAFIRDALNHSARVSLDGNSGPMKFALHMLFLFLEFLHACIHHSLIILHLPF